MAYPILKAGSASDVTKKNQGIVEYGNILAQEMAVAAGILPRVTLQKGGGGSSSSRITSLVGDTLLTSAERTTAVKNLISNVSINATTAARLSAAASGKYGITNIPGTATTATVADAVPVDLFTATGTYTTSIANGRKYYIFTGSGSVVVGTAAATVEIFAVGGGGGGGGGGNGNNGGGGGGGGLQTNSSRYATASQVVSIPALTANATYTVTVGAGGQYTGVTDSPGKAYWVGMSGFNTTFSGTGVSISATGGGGGKGSGGGGAQNAKAGGSGGGGAPQDNLPFLGIGSQGFNGANATPGGGGGIGGSTTGATGGIGLTYPTGGSTYGVGGTSGGGQAGSANTGNGGNGGNNDDAAFGGGSGVFIISYPF